MSQAFISYKTEYRSFAQKVRDFLRGIGYQTWLDDDNIVKGEYFRTEIQKGLEESDVVIGVVTPEAILSREVLTEWDFAFSSKGAKRLILIRYREARLPYWLSGIQYIDFVSDENKGFEQLRKTLETPDATIYHDTTPVEISQFRQEPTATPYLPPDIETISTRLKTKFSSQDKQIERELILLKVYQSWIEGVLRKNTEAGLLEIDHQLHAEAVLKVKDYSDYVLPEGSIGEIFHSSMKRQLLILGAPGSGKTILLLQLAECLLGQAQHDSSQRIPVVFNLSSWTNSKKWGVISRNPSEQFEAWLLDELRRNYNVSEQTNFDSRNYVFLLDGLDEVAASSRGACIEAINAYCKDNLHVDIAICSRIADYQELTTKLDLNGAILISQLRDFQIQKYLQDEESIGIRELIANEAIAKEMAQTPFLLNTMKLAYKGLSYSGNPNRSLKLDSPTLETRSDHLFRAFLEQRLIQAQYLPKEILRYLGWLGAKMTKESRSIFYTDNLKPSDLPSIYGKLYRFIFGLPTGLLMGFSLSVFGGISAFALGTLTITVPENNITMDDMITNGIISIFISIIYCRFFLRKKIKNNFISNRYNYRDNWHNGV
jgi:hypothetical protein